MRGGRTSTPCSGNSSTPPAASRSSATGCSSKPSCTRHAPGLRGGTCPMSSATGTLSVTAFAAGKSAGFGRMFPAFVHLVATWMMVRLFINTPLVCKPVQTASLPMLPGVELLKFHRLPFEGTFVVATAQDRACALAEPDHALGVRRDVGACRRAVTWRSKTARHPASCPPDRVQCASDAGTVDRGTHDDGRSERTLREEKALLHALRHQRERPASGRARSSMSAARRRYEKR